MKLNHMALILFLMILPDLGGGFLVIDEEQAQEFSNKFFEGLDINTLKIGGKLSPKILIVNPMHVCLGSTITDGRKPGKCIKDLLESLEAILMLKTK